MTNEEVIQLLAAYYPEKIAEVLDDCYCMGWNDGAYSNERGVDKQSVIPFDGKWLNSEYDKDLWREEDILEARYRELEAVKKENHSEQIDDIEPICDMAFRHWDD